MSDIVLAVSPNDEHLILYGDKDVVVRRVMPKKLKIGDTVYLSHSGSIHGQAEVANILRIPSGNATREILTRACMTPVEFYNYTIGRPTVGLIVLNAPKRYDHPRPYQGSTIQNFIYC